MPGRRLHILGTLRKAMRMVIVSADASADLPVQAIVCHDVRNPQQRSEVLVRKGSLLAAHDIAPLLARGVTELHLAVPAPNDVAEDEAAQRLAAAVAGPAGEPAQARFGQVTFSTASPPVLPIHASRPDAVHPHHDPLLLP